MFIKTKTYQKLTTSTQNLICNITDVLFSIYKNPFSLKKKLNPFIVVSRDSILHFVIEHFSKEVLIKFQQGINNAHIKYGTGGSMI